MELHFARTTLTVTDECQKFASRHFRRAACPVSLITWNPCVGDTDPEQ